MKSGLEIFGETSRCARWLQPLARRLRATRLCLTIAFLPCLVSPVAAPPALAQSEIIQLPALSVLRPTSSPRIIGAEHFPLLPGHASPGWTKKNGRPIIAQPVPVHVAPTMVPGIAPLRASFALANTTGRNRPKPSLNIARFTVKPPPPIGVGGNITPGATPFSSTRSGFSALSSPSGEFVPSRRAKRAGAPELISFIKPDIARMFNLPPIAVSTQRGGPVQLAGGGYLISGDTIPRPKRKRKKAPKKPKKPKKDVEKRPAILAQREKSLESKEKTVSETQVKLALEEVPQPKPGPVGEITLTTKGKAKESVVPITSVAEPAASRAVGARQNVEQNTPARTSAPDETLIGSVPFEAESVELSDAGKTALKTLLSQFSRDEAVKIQLRAYASNKESTPARRTSLNRALAVRVLLIENQIRRTRIDIRALGRDTGNDEAGKPGDRVDIFELR